ncbi:proto-oncogene tyrosine-protein kinase ROS-like [Daktulosphaira vitifoliae]|uniref:proto-oncogene tyrosine-protein kinase ROS-like n=1 Tax=Daktulosphaira vitifoliae TaxID=58002 RepID=UPI0021AA444B|nr:proto-oncogene tyrosine-protein kinase ROS-like [Daktulosphaira vitifoliae]
MASMAANILLVAVVIVLLAAITQSLLSEKIDTVQVTCSKKCPRQNETKSDEDILCGNQCITNQCFKGCSLWNKALKRNCISVCTDFDERYNFTYGQHYCTAGCNDAISLYFQRIQNEVGILPPPTLVPNSLMDTSLKLQWKGVKRNDFLYKIQWKLEYNSSFWQYCQKQDWINNFIVKLEDLLPFTNYRFRVVLLLEWSGTLQLIVSDPSVVISTRPSKVPPSSAPKIVRITPTDSSISITWAAIPFPLAPILSYHLTIQEFSKGYYAFKEILTEKENKIENVYMFRNLEPHKNYSITVAARNEFGDGSITAAIVTTLPSTKLKYTPEPINLILISDYSIYCTGKELYDIPRQLYHHNKKINSMTLKSYAALRRPNGIAKNPYNPNGILRENLFGGQRELLISSSTAKELKVESVGGYLYWSTEYSIQSSKLNGKELYNYYTVNYITGEITSLAVDSVGHWVYWILREKDKSKLFRAPTFEKLIDSIFSPVQEFENLNSQGPLFYVDHHLLWLQNGNDLVISDSDGQYPAIIKALNFNGIQTFTVLDPHTRPKPNGSNTTVIPEEVNINMIKVYPKINDTTFEIVWNPVTNVNHGLVLYNVIVLEKEDNTNSCISNFNTPNTHVLIHSVPLKISIEATTVWGSSKTVTVFSPIPPEPTNIRIFTKINFSDQNRDIVLQHSRLDNISHYEVHCQYNNDYIWRNCSNKTIISSSIQTTWKNLSLNIDYEFKIKACSTASCGKWSKVIVLNKVFSVTSLNTAMVFDSEILIFHANKLNNQTLIKTDSLVKFVAFDSLEDIVYWSDGINIFNSSINISDQTKVYTKTDNRVKIENLSFDWVSRTLLWCETSINQSTIISWDLISGSRNIIITSLHSTINFLVVPSERMLIWIEKSNFYGTKKVMKLSMDTHSIHRFYNSILDNEKNNCNCSNMNPINDVITLYISNNGKNKLLWIDSDKQNIIISDIYGCECWTVKFMFPIHGITSMAVDRNNLFWTTNKKSLYFLSIEEENNLPIIKNYNTTNYLDNINAVFTIDRMPETFKRPNPPGLPKVNCLLSGCTVHWDKSESAVEVIYHLDRRFVIDDRNKRSLRNIEHDWMPVYKGPNNYWFIPDVKPNLSFMFRVRARNTFGWSDYIASDEPFKAQYQVETLRDENIPKIVLIACFIFMCLILAMITNYYWGPCKTKGPMRPDVELGRLREMPQRSTFFHAINVGYQGAVLFKKKEKSELPIIKREQISLNKQLGSGAFGEVFEGKIKNLINCETETRVAIKVLKEGATQSEMAAFMKEAKLMNNFKHKHILQLIGVCIDNDPNFIIMELMEGGDLLSYLRKNRPTSVTKSCLTLIDLIRMCIDVAEGCSYLEQMHFVHRDLACRNCLITSSDPRNLVVKIGDFGLARNIYTHDYYRRAGESLLPVKWMSPESVVDCVFTCQSDVWAFGVLLWEIMSMGQHPYPGYSNFKVICYVQQGGRLEKPINCPRTLYNLMQRCWSDDPIKRPKFEYCLKILKSFMAMPLDYVNISYDSQLQNLSTSESYTVDITYSGSYDKQITHPKTNEGYEVPDKIINNEYLNLGGIEYLDLSKTSLKPPIANNARNTEPELIMTEDTLLYCNMSTEQS